MKVGQPGSDAVEGSFLNGTHLGHFIKILPRCVLTDFIDYFGTNKSDVDALISNFKDRQTLYKFRY